MKGGDLKIASTLHRRHMEIHAEDMADPASCRSQLAHSTCTSEGIYTDSMFMVSDCRRIYLERIEAAGRVACPGAPRVNFENCDRTLRGIWQEIMPELVREFSDPGPKCVTLPGLSLAYRVACLLFARSREERSALVATGFEPLVPRCPRPAHAPVFYAAGSPTRGRPCATCFGTRDSLQRAFLFCFAPAGVQAACCAQSAAVSLLRRALLLPFESSSR